MPNQAGTLMMESLHNWNSPNDFWLRLIFGYNQSLEIRLISEDVILILMTWETIQENSSGFSGSIPISTHC